jgi:hypothetical protein
LAAAMMAPRLASLRGRPRAGVVLALIDPP